MSEFKNYQVTVCGGGNGAHVTAGYFASKGIKVNVFTRRPNDWKKSIKITTATSSWSHKGEFFGNLNKVSSNPADVAPGSDLFIVCAPANAHPDLVRAVAPYVKKGAYVGALYAQGGFDWACKSIFGPRFNDLGGIFGMQNIPWICKITHYGREARILGPKQNLYVASYPTEKANVIAELLGKLYDIPCQIMPNFLNLTLSPSNQIIHPGRYYGIFRDWDGKRVYSKEELKARDGLTLYEDMDEFSAEQLAAVDNELQQIKFALLQRYPELDLSFVRPLGERIALQYGPDVSDRSSLRKIFQTNKGYVGCGTPLREVQGGYWPNVNTRLFWEDIPYGLCILKNLAELMGNFPTPTIDFLIRWHQQFMGKKYLLDDGQLNPDLLAETGTPMKYGMYNIEQVVQTSLPRRSRL
jgi:hypothetical protein